MREDNPKSNTLYEATVFQRSMPGSELLPDKRGYILNVFGARIKLQAVETRYLVYLHERFGQVVNRQAIYADVFNQPNWQEGGSNEADVYVNYLRNKLKKIPGTPLEIETVWGVGYKLKNKLV